VDVDVDTDRALLAVLAKLPSVHADAEFLAGVYRDIKPAGRDALKRYLQQSDPPDDAPSHHRMRGVPRESRRGAGRI
jgi:hypothetical protein